MCPHIPSFHRKGPASFLTAIGQCWSRRQIRFGKKISSDQICRSRRFSKIQPMKGLCEVMTKHGQYLMLSRRGEMNRRHIPEYPGNCRFRIIHPKRKPYFLLYDQLGSFEVIHSPRRTYYPHLDTLLSDVRQNPYQCSCNKRRLGDRK